MKESGLLSACKHEAVLTLGLDRAMGTISLPGPEDISPVETPMNPNQGK